MGDDDERPVASVEIGDLDATDHHLLQGHRRCHISFVMPGPAPGIHEFLHKAKTWMAGTSPAMTRT
jgi:hypothetical protein